MLVPLQGLTPAAMVRAFPVLTLEEARQVVAAVHRHGALDGPLPRVRRAGMAALRAGGAVPGLRVCEERRSALDPFVKWVLAAPDGALIEAVRIPLERPGRYSVCVSSQVGCGLACSFCATGRMGLARNLETWEIVEQVRHVRRSLDGERAGRVHGVVFQGMGEPLANLDRVLEAIAVLTDPCALAIDAKRITVCTAGLPSGIRRMAREAPRVRLAISIGSARPGVRRALMPIDRRHPLGEVLAAAEDHARTTGNAPMWAVTLLAGVNDDPEDARALGAIARDFEERTGVRPRVTIVPYNPIAGPADDPFARVGACREAAFRDALRAVGVFTHKRYSGGADVGAACGQLGARLRAVEDGVPPGTVARQDTANQAELGRQEAARLDGVRLPASAPCEPGGARS